MRDRIKLIEEEHPEISVRRQCELFQISRSNLDYLPVPEPPENLRIKRLLDEIYLIDPCLGARRLVTVLERDYQLVINIKRLRRLRKEIGHETIYCRRRTSIPDNTHRKYPYLLRGLAITRPNHVWCADITYVPMERGHGFLCAVMDWHSRKVLSWALSNTMDVGLCLNALNQAFESNDVVPEIFNTDQGCQFTCAEWIEALESCGVQISMDGKGRWMDNVFIERLWRSIKYECIYLFGHLGLNELRSELEKWITRYNNWRPHQHLNNETPSVVYERQTAPA